MLCHRKVISVIFFVRLYKQQQVMYNINQSQSKYNKKKTVTHHFNEQTTSFFNNSHLTNAHITAKMLIDRKCMSTRSRYKLLSIQYRPRRHTILSYGQQHHRHTATNVKVCYGALPARGSDALNVA